MLRTAEAYLQLSRRRYFYALEVHAAIIGSIAAVVVVIGYGFNVEALQSLAPGFPTMKLRTASSLMGLSLAYMLSLRRSDRAHWGAMGVAVGVLGLVLHTVSFPPTPVLGDPWSAAPSLATLLCLAGSAISLLVITLAPQFSVLAGTLALGAATLGMFRIVDLIIFAGAPDPISPLNTMALHTAALITWFALVCLMLHPVLPFGRGLLQASLRGRLLRRALPFAILLPVASAAISFGAHGLLGWPSEAMFAFSATVTVSAGVALVWWLSSIAERWQTEANAQAARLSRANEALEQYASAAAHDLKAPARHVLLYGELLEEALARGDIEAARRNATAIRESAGVLPPMIEGMLDYSRSAFVRITLTDVSLSELVQAATAQVADDLQAVGGRVRILSDARLLCDSTLLTTVFQNLIANAIKSRRRDRQLEIKITCDRGDTDWHIALEDNGVGFDHDTAVVAFNPLARGAHVAGDGAGIGLATCRNIMQSHGGAISVDPAHRQGARIVFTLPLSPKSAG